MTKMRHRMFDTYGILMHRVKYGAGPLVIMGATGVD